MKPLVPAAVAASLLTAGAAAPAAAQTNCGCKVHHARYVHKARHVVHRAAYREYVSETAYAPPPPPVTVFERETVFVRPRPVFVEPPPVFYRPRPVFVAGPPVFYRPHPVFVRPHPVFYGSGYRHGWDGPRVAYGGWDHRGFRDGGFRDGGYRHDGYRRDWR
jgi:hypothetical protein